MGVFTLASVACSVAPNLWLLVVFRLIQAAGAAGLMPTSLGLLLAAVPAEKRMPYVRIWSAVAGEKAEKSHVQRDLRYHHRRRQRQDAATFWAGALGRTLADGADETAAAVEADPNVPGSRIGFRQVPEDKKVKNRMHFDLVTSDFDVEVGRLTDLGASRLHEVDAHIRHATFADPEGNEFDLIAG
jgi:hypothetical protein